MKNDKKMFVLVEVILAVLVAILAFMMIQEKNGKNLDKVSVIIQNSDDSQWAAFKYGLKMAAQDQGIEIFVVSTGEELTLEEERRVIEREIDNGADAVIVQPVLENDTEKILKKIEKKVPVMLVEHTASKGKKGAKLPIVEPDHYAMGKALAQELLEDYNGNMEGKTLGILSESEELESIRNRRKGLMDELKGTGFTIRWSVDKTSEKEKKTSLKAQSKVDVVVALDNHSFITAGRCLVTGNLNGALLYGIGNSTEAVYYLDTKVAECLVVPDEFNTGYQSLTEVAKNLKNYFYNMKDKTVSYTVIRKDTLFSKENQEILFTLSQ